MILKRNWKNIRIIAEELFNYKALNSGYFKNANNILKIKRITLLKEV